MRLEIRVEGQNFANLVSLGEAICHMADGIEVDEASVEFLLDGVTHVLIMQGAENVPDAGGYSALINIAPK